MKINKEKYENNSCNGEKNKQLKDLLLHHDIIKKEKFSVNKYPKYEFNVECYRTDFKNDKISRKSGSNSKSMPIDEQKELLHGSDRS